MIPLKIDLDLEDLNPDDYRRDRTQQTMRESFYGHAGRPGQRGGSTKADVASKAVGAIKKNSGVTISVAGDIQKSGFAVAGLNNEKVFDQQDFNRKDVLDYIQAYRAELSGPKRYLGGWVHKGDVYLDTTEVHANKTIALDNAHGRNEYAIYDLGKNKEIFTMSDEKRPKESSGTRIRESIAQIEDRTGTTRWSWPSILVGQDLTDDQKADAVIEWAKGEAQGAENSR